MSAMMMKLGKLACAEADVKTPNSQYFVRYSIKPKPGSVIDKMVKEGKVTYVPPEELESRKRAKA